MFNKNYIFIIASIFLGILISFYYNREFNIKFVYYFMIITISLYIIFYLLGRSNTEETFTDYYSNNKFINNKFYNIDGKIINEEQHIRDSLDNDDNLVPQEEHMNIPQEENVDYHIPQEEHMDYHIPQEEHMTYHIPQEENMNIPQEEHMTYYIPQEKQRDILSPDRYTLPNSGITGPLNINISYNAQNSMNELTEPKSKSDRKLDLRNIGSIDYADSSRIYNNSDWIYGNQAWTNEPDYYIPQKDLVNSGPIQSLMNPVQNIMNTPIKDIINSKSVQSIINTPIKDIIN